MITKVGMPVYTARTISKSSPSFGLAKLNERARRSADAFGYERNDYLDPKMFTKQGFLSSSALTKAVQNGENFVSICREYGCSQLADVNADFIKSQILTSKFNASIHYIEEEDLKRGLSEIYAKNYDNPKLSLKNTQDLLLQLKDVFSDEEYAKHTGILAVTKQR